MIVQLLTEHDLEFLSLKCGCTGSSESTFVKMIHCVLMCFSQDAAYLLAQLSYHVTLSAFCRTRYQEWRNAINI